MKLAYILDVAGVKSFYVKNGEAYTFKDDKPYTFHHSVSPSLFMGGWNYPFLWKGGCYLNLNEFKQNEWDLPDYDFDLIMYGNERCGLDPDTYDEYRVDILREKYPNAKILGWFKEIEIPHREGRQPERLKNRIRFFKDCDVVASHAVPGDTPMKTLDQLKEIESSLGKKIDYYISHPINIEGYYDNFYSDKKDISIFAYLPNPFNRRGDTYDFCNYLGKKYKLPGRYKPLRLGQEFAYMSQKEFIELWSPSLFHFNLDPSIVHPGMQCIQVAAVGSINMGGLNEAHNVLFPDVATNDRKILEEKFVEYLNDEVSRFRVMEYAWEKLNEVYTYDLVKKQITDILEELNA